MGKKFFQAKTNIDSGDKWEDDLPFEVQDIRDVARGDFRAIRLVGYLEPFMRFWVPTDSRLAYDPYKTKAKQYPSVCVDFDPVEEDFSGNECLYRKAHYEYTDPDTGETKWGKLKPTKNYVIFFIDRETQEERTGIPIARKIKSPKKQSDIKCAIVPTAFAKAVQNVIELYAKKVKKTVDPTDDADGYDIFFKFDPEAKAEAKYSAQLGDAAPLTEEELAQVALIPTTIKVYPKDDPDKIRESLARHGYVIVESGEDPDEVKAASKAAKKSPKKGTLKAGVEMLDDDDDDDDEEEFEDESGDLKETPVPAKAKAKVVKAAPVDDDLDLDEDEEEADEEEEEAPAPAPKAKAKKAKAAPVEDDDDEDFDWDDDDQ